LVNRWSRTVELKQEELATTFNSRLLDLNRLATNIPSACRITNIAFNDAIILPYDANPGQMKFSERTGIEITASAS
jgi:hypothetical protein